MAAHLERLIRIYNRLRRGPVTIEVISKWAKGAGINVSDRQLYRDLNQLVGLRVAEGENVVEYMDEKNHKTWKLEYEDTSNKISLYDINSFFLLKNFAPTGIVEQRKSSIEKFEDIFYKELSKSKYQQYIKTHELYLHRTNYFGHMYGEAEHQQLEELIWSLNNNRAIIIDSIVLNAANVHLSDNPLPLEIRPMELVLHHGRLFVSGLDSKEQLLSFAIDKDTAFHLTNKSFNRKKLFPIYDKQKQVVFGISTPIDGKVYRIKIEFTKNFGESWMRFFWHSSQQWTPLKNGNYMLHLHCSIGRELIGFLAYGLDKIKVHQPKVLKDLFLKKVENTYYIHKNNLAIDEETANKDY